MTGNAVWTPAASNKDCHARLTAAGSPFELETAVIGSRNIRIYKHQPPSLRALWLNTKQFADRDYIVYQDERFKYGQSHDKVDAIVRLLVSLGVRKGTRVGIAMRNLPEFVLLFWATQMIGAVSTLINSYLPVDPLLECITSVNCHLVFLDAERARVLSPAIVKLKEYGCDLVVVRSDSVPYGMKNFNKELDRIPASLPIPSLEVLPDDHSVILYTSGTTSQPKAVLSTNRQFLTSLMNAGLANGRSYLRRGETPPAPDPNARQRAILLGVPLFHAIGLQSSLTSCTAVGGKIVLLYKWDADLAVKLIKSEHITHAGGVANMISDLLEPSNGISDEEHCLESLSFGGSAGSAEFPNEMKKRFGKNAKMTLVQGYGLTETNASVSGHGGEDYFHRPTSCGVISPINDVRIRSDDGTILDGPGRVGEIEVKGQNVACGYVNDEAASREAFSEDGWFKTGDIGYYDEDDFLYILDRSKDLIIRGGENISSITVENAIFKDTRIKDCAVVPVPDAKLGELVAAIVFPRLTYQGKVTEAEIQSHVRTQLPLHSVPVMVVVHTGELPRNAAGKTMKKELKAVLSRMWQERTGAVKAKL